MKEDILNSTCYFCCTGSSVILSVKEKENGFVKENGSEILTEAAQIESIGGICNIQTMQAGGTTPVLCNPQLGSWKKVSSVFEIDGKKVLLKKSVNKCSHGGEIRCIP